MTDMYAPPIGVPVRFLAMTWSAGWEFDRPTILLEPIQRYSPNVQSCESLIEDVAIDMCVDEPVKSGYPSDDTEFHWRGWSWKRFHRIAMECLNGREFPKRHYQAVEQWLEFYVHTEDGLMFRDSQKPNAVDTVSHKSRLVPDNLAKVIRENIEP